jgi:hypothetical protein
VSGDFEIIDPNDHVAQLAQQHGIDWDGEDIQAFEQVLHQGATPAQFETFVSDWVSSAYGSDEDEADFEDWEDEAGFEDALLEELGADAPEPEPEIDLSQVDWTSMDEQSAASLMAQRARQLNGTDADPTTGISLADIDPDNPADLDRADALRVLGYQIEDAGPPNVQSGEIEHGTERFPWQDQEADS